MTNDISERFRVMMINIALFIIFIGNGYVEKLFDLDNNSNKFVLGFFRVPLEGVVTLRSNIPPLYMEKVPIHIYRSAYYLTLRHGNSVQWILLIPY